MLSLLLYIPVSEGQFADHHDNQEDDEGSDHDSNANEEVDASHVN